MNFTIDGTLWEDGSPDGYDIMAGSLLFALQGLGHHFRFLGKSRIVCPSKLTWNAQWEMAERRAEDWLFPSGWLNRSVPRALKAGDPSIWVSFSGQGVPGSWDPVSVNAPRQWVFLKEMAPLLWPEGKKEEESVPKAIVRDARKKWGTTLADPSAGIIVFSAHAGSLLTDLFGVTKDRVRVMPPFAGPGLHQPTWEDRETAKWAYSDGKEYFLWTGSLDHDSHWLAVLKAFSQFKVRQKSQMCLVMAPWSVSDASFHESLSSYKYRADVKVLEAGPDTWKSVARGAYALMYTPSFDELGWVPGISLSQGVPLVSTARSVAREWAGDTVAWVDPGSPEAIAEALMQLYKDERYRALVQAKGLTVAGDASHDRALRAYDEVFTATA